MPHDQYNGQEIFLHRGDVIKLGRVAFRIKDFCVDGSSVPLPANEAILPYQDGRIDLQPTKVIPA